MTTDIERALTAYENIRCSGGGEYEAMRAAILEFLSCLEEPSEAALEEAADAADGHYEIDGDKGPWLRHAGFAAALRVVIAAKRKEVENG